ncbi:MULTISPECIES: class I SAM-dependent methyltransferase [Microbacterium]|uniref:class I SAM-dependent methyltransferase n=1 Tax=Microbacterium TaxID=33882 RepID=UPI00217DD5C8|nr:MULTISPECIES: class I SAM-dependent methyltransferase [Microbacterium]UWF78410.1 class I SAM-dependent methyltransferase [Microbacterium neungamense]WCM56585.1 class I SAM-dependent methyltransferase [Microbacterium sp. EF45047]
MSWAGVGAAYAASYAALCAGTGERMRELLGPGRGRTLLDVGAGDGRLAAAWSDAGWRVVACEPEPSMRAAARQRHPHLRIVAGGLPHLPFANRAADAVTANFVLNHVADPRAGAAELRRVAAETVAATIWTRSPTALWLDVFERAGLEPASGTPLPADKDFERTAAGFERMLRDAGWRPEVTELTWTWTPDAETLWTSVEGGVAGAGAAYRNLAAPERARFRRAFDEVVAAGGGRVRLEQTAAIAVHRAPGWRLTDIPVESG